MVNHGQKVSFRVHPSQLSRTCRHPLFVSLIARMEIKPSDLYNNLDPLLCAKDFILGYIA